MTQIRLQTAELDATIDPQGARIQQLIFRPAGLPVLYENPTGGLFPMLPVSNRVAGNGFVFQGREVMLPHHAADEHFFSHGDGWQLRWKVIENGDDYCVLQLRRQYACGFDYLAQIRYQLQNNQLLAVLTLTHYGAVPMPYGGGFHPWFNFDKQSQVQFQASGYWPEGEQHLPRDWQGTLPDYADFSQAQYGEDDWLNVCYSGWSGRAKVVSDVMDITITSQTPWLMLFRMRGEPFICLEPQSHPVNAHNMDGQPGLRVLGAGDVLQFTMKITAQRRE